MIYFDNVTKSYPDNSVALSDISLAVEPGEIVTIMGPSGAGKTTLLKLLLAEVAPTKGKVFFESVDVHKINRRHLHRLRRRIGSIFQDFKLLPQKNVFENIAFTMEAAGRTDEEIVSDVPHILGLVGLEHKMWNFPHELSRGEQQRVAIARGLVNQPDLLIADEPTGSLDAATAKDIVDIFKKINDIGTTVVLTTHNRDVAHELGRRVVTIEGGRIVSDHASHRRAS